MSEDLQEQAYWMLLAFASGLNTHIVNPILEAWCYQGKHSLQEFFAASPQVWNDTCHLSSDNSKKLELAKEKLSRHVSLIEQLSHDHIHLLTVLEDNYPRLLKSSLKREQRPPVLFYAGDLSMLERQTIAIIGSRKAGEESLAFTRAVSAYFAEHGANVISGNARGVDRTTYEGATSTEGHTTVVLPHGVCKLNGVQWRAVFVKKLKQGKCFY